MPDRQTNASKPAAAPFLRPLAPEKPAAKQSIFRRHPRLTFWGSTVLASAAAGAVAALADPENPEAGLQGVVFTFCGILLVTTGVQCAEAAGVTSCPDWRRAWFHLFHRSTPDERLSIHGDTHGYGSADDDDADTAALLGAGTGGEAAGVGGPGAANRV